MLSEVAQCENQARGRRMSAPRAVAGSTCVTIARDFAAAVAEHGLEGAWAAKLAQAEVSADGAGGRPAGTRSDAAAVFRARFEER